MRGVFQMDGKKKKVTEFMCYRNGKMTESEIKEATPAYKESYTYADYITWDDDIRWELIDGIVWDWRMVPKKHLTNALHVYIMR